MNGYWHNLLAVNGEDGWGALTNLLILLLLLGVSAFGHLIARLKRRYEMERAKQEAEQARGRRVPRQPPPAAVEPAEEQDAVLRQLFGARGPIRGAPAPSAGPSDRRPARPSHGRAKEIRRAARAEAARKARQARAAQTAAPLRVEEEGPRPGIGVDLGRRGEALRGIVYSEILGLPKALRRGPEPWER